MRFAARCFLLLAACSVARAGVIGSPEPAASDDLLASVDWHWLKEMDSSLPLSASSAVFGFVTYPLSGVPSVLETTPWQDNQTGYSDFTDVGVDFHGVTAALIDDVDDFVTLGARFQFSPTVHGTMSFTSSESYFFGLPSSLSGADITLVRCSVAALTFQQTSPSTVAVSAEVAWSFYGTVPEPGAGLAAAAVLVVIGARRRLAA